MSIGSKFSDAPRIYPDKVDLRTVTQAPTSGTSPRFSTILRGNLPSGHHDRDLPGRVGVVERPDRIAIRSNRTRNQVCNFFLGNACGLIELLLSLTHCVVDDLGRQFQGNR